MAKIDDDELLVDLDPAAPTEGDGASIEPMGDGSVVVDFDPKAKKPQGAVVDEDNLAEALDDQTLDSIAAKVIEMVDADQLARKDWQDRLTKGLEKCGLLGADLKAAFEGGSTVIHPLIVEAAVQFQARAIEELFPASGPVKARVIGESDEVLEDQAERVEAHMNYQITVEDQDYFDEVDKMLFALPFMGSCFKKSYWDEEEGCVVSRYIEAERVLVPYSAKNIRRAPRITHVIPYSATDLRARMASGFYLDEDRARLGEPTTTGTETLGTQSDQVAPSGLTEDNEYEVYEMQVNWALPGADGNEGEVAPYIISVEKEYQRVLSIRANVDEEGNKRTWFTHYRYLPGLGVYGYGLFHTIGGLGDAATAALRELLDSATFATRQGGFKSVDAKFKDKNNKIEPGVWKDTDMTADELHKAFYTPDFKEPSAALFNLLGMIVQSGQRFASTTEAMVGEGAKSIPVGTTIARIEQGSKVYSAIHKRLHRAAGAEFKLRARLNFEHLDEGKTFGAFGKNMQISREDYDARIDVEPVSDPNIISTPQRIALAQAALERSKESPLYDKLEAEKRYLRALKTPDIDKLLIDPADVKSADPVTEGQLLLAARPIRAFAEQDHAAHLLVHQGQVQLFQGTPVAQTVLPALMAHMAEHIGHQYRIEMSAKLGVPLPTIDPNPRDQKSIPPQIDQAISQGAAQIVQQQMQEQAAQQEDQMQQQAVKQQIDALLRQAEAMQQQAAAMQQVAMMGTQESMPGQAPGQLPPQLPAQVPSPMQGQVPGQAPEQGMAEGQPLPEGGPVEPIDQAVHQGVQTVLQVSEEEATAIQQATQQAAMIVRQAGEQAVSAIAKKAQRPVHKVVHISNITRDAAGAIVDLKAETESTTSTMSKHISVNNITRDEQGHITGMDAEVHES